MVADLNLPTAHRGGGDGARARRPGALEPQPLPRRAQRRAALALAESLRAADAAAGDGLAELLAEGVAAFGDHDGVSLDYFVVVDPRHFLPVDDDYRGRARVLVAAQVGATRLIDNAFVEVGREA